MLTNCLKGGDKQIVKTRGKTKNGQIMLLSNCVVCDRFVKEQAAKGLLGNLVGLLSKIPLISPILF